MVGNILIPARRPAQPTRLTFAEVGEHGLHGRLGGQSLLLATAVVYSANDQCLLFTSEEPGIPSYLAQVG